MATQLQNIGQALQGFGAGIQGNLPQLMQARTQQQALQQQQQLRQQQMQAQQQQAQQERLKQITQSGYRDADSMWRFIEEDNLDGAIQLGLSRAALEEQLMGQPNPVTQELTRLTVAARNLREESPEEADEALEIVKDRLETLREMGMAEGVIERPERETKVVGDALVDVDTGQPIYQAEQGAGPVTGVQSFVDEQGNFVGTFDLSNPEDRAFVIQNSLRRAPSRVEQGGPGGFTTGETVDFRAITRNTAQTIDAVNRLQEQLREGGASVLGVVGGTQRFIGQAGAQIDAAAESFGVNLNPANYDFDNFDQDAVRSAQLRSNVVRLAFLIAQQRNPDGRISDPDVQAAIREIGSSQDPVQFAGVLDEVERGQIRNYNIIGRQFHPEIENPYEEFVTPLFGPQEEVNGPARIQNAEDYDALPSGREYIDPSGVLRRKP